MNVPRPPDDVRLLRRLGVAVFAALLAAGAPVAAAPLDSTVEVYPLPEPGLSTPAEPDFDDAPVAAPKPVAKPVAKPRRNAAFAHLYAARPQEKHALPATNVSGVASRFLRQEVAYPRAEKPGTIVVDPTSRFLYLVLPNGRAMRYGVGVGKEGFSWAGKATIGRKAEWPRWTPTAEMIERDPERYGRWAEGMDSGLKNPLGPRALYLYADGRDTLYRIHGTNEPRSIGRNASSGCIRMFNQDVIDLYDRAKVGGAVVVLAQGERVEPGRTETVVAKSRREPAAQSSARQARLADRRLARAESRGFDGGEEAFDAEADLSRRAARAPIRAARRGVVDETFDLPEDDPWSWAAPDAPRGAWRGAGRGAGVWEDDGL